MTTVLRVDGQGPVITGVGPINRSMGGAGTAAPLDAIGSLHWNPASIQWLAQSELSFGLELMDVNVDLSSTVGGATNTTRGDAGFSPVPSIGWVHHVEDTPLTLGLGVSAIAGFSNNMPIDSANLLLAGGPAFASAEFLQIAPTFAYSVTDQLSLGIAPTITTATLTFDPLGPSVITPASTAGSGNRMHWGGGFQAGAFYQVNQAWSLGLSYKSKQWFESFNFFTPGGTVRFDLDYPMIVSLGTAYTGMERWTIAADIRYLDFENTDGFRELGFSSVFALAVGAQYRLNEMIALRCGYNANANPIHQDDVLTNIFTPLIQDQNVAAGATIGLAEHVDLNLAYVYLVENEITGPLPSPPFGANDTLTNQISAHSAIFGISVRY